MVQQWSDCRVAARRVRRSAAITVLLVLVAAVDANPTERDLFDEIYARGRAIETSLKTITARFTETTTSSLLTTPLVAHGTLTVERPAKIVLHYDEPEKRTLLIDGDRLTLAWPSRGAPQQTDIGAAKRRIDKYFVDKSPDELRRNFQITATEASDRPGTWRITMAPRRKQIKEGLTQLELWLDRTSLLLSAMRMTFPNSDTKLMVFDNVIVNGPVDPNVFSTGGQSR
jgi:outer membrane lipoprotein-sorting protein